MAAKETGYDENEFEVYGDKVHEGKYIDLSGKRKTIQMSEFYLLKLKNGNNFIPPKFKSHTNDEKPYEWWDATLPTNDIVLDGEAFHSISRRMDEIKNHKGKEGKEAKKNSGKAK